MLFNAGEETDTHAESLLNIFFTYGSIRTLTNGTNIFAHAIEHEAEGIELLLRVNGIALIVEFPVCATIHGVDEMLKDIVLGTGSRSKILRLAEHTIGSREAPQDSGIEYSALACLLHENALTCHTTIEAAVFLILKPKPEREDVVLKARKKFRPKVPLQLPRGGEIFR
jgi:hypothetical protein